MEREGGRKRRLIAVAAAGLLAAGLLPTLGGGHAATPRAEADALRTRQGTLERTQRAALLDLYALESKLARSRAALVDLRARSAGIAHARTITRHRAAAVQHSLAGARKQLAQTLRTLYKQGQPDPVAILLGATSIEQAIDGLDDLSRTAKGNRRLIESLRSKELRLRALDAQLLAQGRVLEAARRSAEAGVADLERAVGERSATLASLRTRADLTRREVARLDALAREAQRRSAKLAAPRPAAPAAATSPPSQPSQPSQPAPRPAAPGGTRTLVVDAVAYHLPGHTASGLPVGKGIVAVDPTVIPLGTRLFVPGYGPAVAADVGSAVKGNIIDLWMPSTAQALAWGRRTVTITIYG